MAVIDNDEVLLARMVSGATMASSRRSNSCLASRRSTMASTTSSQSPSCSRRSATRSRFCAASASAALSLPLPHRLSKVCRRRWRASAAASARLSNSHTVRPAWAAIWAIPVPIAPVPTTAIQRISGIVYSPW
ncbi:Uncharacterised protein [Acinetobacter baumannii]|nr:Uncharacterised protein [Acinetobacter baumannii]